MAQIHPIHNMAHIHPSSSMFKDWRSFMHLFRKNRKISPTTKSFPISPKGKKTTRKKRVAWNPPNCHAHHLQHTWLPRTLGLIFQAFPRVGGVGSLGSFSTCKVGKQDWAPIAISIGGYNSTHRGSWVITLQEPNLLAKLQRQLPTWKVFVADRNEENVALAVARWTPCPVVDAQARC